MPLLASLLPWIIPPLQLLDFLLSQSLPLLQPPLPHSLLMLPHLLHNPKRSSSLLLSIWGQTFIYLRRRSHHQRFLSISKLYSLQEMMFQLLLIVDNKFVYLSADFHFKFRNSVVFDSSKTLLPNLLLCFQQSILVQSQYYLRYGLLKIQMVLSLFTLLHPSLACFRAPFVCRHRGTRLVSWRDSYSSRYDEWFLILVHTLLSFCICY